MTDEAFGSSEFLDPRDLVQVKDEMVRRVQVDQDAVSHAAAAFGFSRPSFYQAEAALESGGLPGLMPQRPGPRRAHKLTEQIVAFAEETLAADPTLRPRDLVAAIDEAFGWWCTPAPSSALSPAGGRRKVGSHESAPSSLVEHYEELRRRALHGECDGRCPGLAVLHATIRTPRSFSSGGYRF